MGLSFRGLTQLDLRLFLPHQQIEVLLLFESTHVKHKLLLKVKYL